MLQRKQRQAQRAATSRPTTNIKAQRRAARASTKYDFYEVTGSGGGAEDERGSGGIIELLRNGSLLLELMMKTEGYIYRCRQQK